MKDLKEQIEVMTHFMNGGKVEAIAKKIQDSNWVNAPFPCWDWDNYDYRIKEEKKTVVIEKWLCEYNNCGKLKGGNRFFIIEKAFPFEIPDKKIKLLGTYEVEL